MNRVARELPAWLNVSRETFGRLCGYCDLVEKWNPAVNLISKSSIPDLWRRHLIDSAQIILQIPEGAESWCDLGSGGGFPGVVVAIVAKEMRPTLSVTLVESDRRKAVFLSEALRMLDVRANVRTERIETLAPQLSDVLSARALAPLVQLCGFAHRHLKSTGTALFPKGAGAEQELADAQTQWTFSSTEFQSLTDQAGRILALRDIRHA